jgi:type IV secretory pathway VirB9-like protein
MFSRPYTYLTTITAPLLRLVGANGAELVNYRQVGTTYILDGLFNLAELRVGSGEPAGARKRSTGMPSTGAGRGVCASRVQRQ